MFTAMPHFIRWNNNRRKAAAECVRATPYYKRQWRKFMIIFCIYNVWTDAGTESNTLPFSVFQVMDCDTLRLRPTTSVPSVV
ncbi:hypothetical protein TNCV_2358821 [Trichonephila clavipes]|nr:hypothetical protein TNCV_2358821 [Trichonephila clavipes]